MPFAFRSHRRSGLTLVEILIALSMTLVVLGAMTSAFRFASEEMRSGRALIELANRARIVEDQLRSDLENLTVETRVYDGTDEPEGYFEYIEGSIRDDTFANSVENYQGDCDDILAFTARSSDGALYRGRQNFASTLDPVIESSVAEIAWFCTVIDNHDNARNEVSFQRSSSISNSGVGVTFDDTLRVHRRVLLIRPDLGMVATGLRDPEVDEFIRNNDISVRVIPTGGGRHDLIANSLDDLAIRSNRFAHGTIGFDGHHRFPNNLNTNDLVSRVVDDEDFPPILSDIGAFDVRVYSPNALVGVVGGVIVEPSDPGYDAIDFNDLEPLGAYVDLGYIGFGSPGTTIISPGGTPPTTPRIVAGREVAGEWFAGTSIRPPSRAVNQFNPANQLPGGWTGNVWDTWTPAYENDGFDQDGNMVVDQATNGVNDVFLEDNEDASHVFPDGNPNSNVVDDPAERETSPPYTQPIRGLKVTLRLVEKGTKQVHQISIIHSFVPE